jgi:hypothetical protein
MVLFFIGKQRPLQCDAIDTHGPHMVRLLELSAVDAPAVTPVHAKGSNTGSCTVQQVIGR